MSDLIGISSDDFKKPDFIFRDQSKMNLQERIDYNIRYIETKIKRVMEFDEIEKIKQQDQIRILDLLNANVQEMI